MFRKIEIQPPTLIGMMIEDCVYNHIRYRKYCVEKAIIDFMVDHPNIKIENITLRGNPWAMANSILVTVFSQIACIVLQLLLFCIH